MLVDSVTYSDEEGSEMAQTNTPPSTYPKKVDYSDDEGDHDDEAHEHENFYAKF